MAQNNIKQEVPNTTNNSNIRPVSATPQQGAGMSQQQVQAQQQQRRQGNQQFSPADLNRIVLEYLNKKGYHRTEAILRVESSHTPTIPLPSTNRSIPNDSSLNYSTNSREKLDPLAYERGYSLLKAWVENSLEIYRFELYRVLYPLFVHCFLDLISKNYTHEARVFFNKFSKDHEILHGSEISKFSSIGNPEHLEENELAKSYRNKKYVLYITRTCLNLLLYFLHENEALGGSLLISLINGFITPVIINNEALNSGEGSLDDGIKDFGSVDEIEKFNSQPVKLGPFPKDPQFEKEVQVELERRDAKESVKPTLVEEYKKLNESTTNEESPLKESLPLPQHSYLDIKREIIKVKESRDAIKLDSLQVASPSVCMYTFHNHNNELTTLEFNENSNLIAGGFQDSYIKLWSLDGSPINSILSKDSKNLDEPSRKLIGHNGSVYGLSFSPDDKYLLSSSEDKTVRLWSLDTYTSLVSYKGHNHPVWDVKFSPFGHYFATASHDQTARLWSCDHIYPLRIFAGHLNDVDCVEFHPNSTYVFTGSSDKTIRMWDIAKGQSVRIFQGHTGAINTMAVSPDGRWLASAGEDSIINIFDIGTGRRLKSMRGHGRCSIYSLSFNKEGTMLVSGASDNSVRVWDIKKGTGEAGPQPDPFPINTSDNTTSVSTNGVNGKSSTGKVDEVKRRKEVIPTTDHMCSFFTKRTSVYKVHFTRGNLCLAAGVFNG